jgi:hypothetical protein
MRNREAPRDEVGSIGIGLGLNTPGTPTLEAWLPAIEESKLQAKLISEGFHDGHDPKRDLPSHPGGLFGNSRCLRNRPGFKGLKAFWSSLAGQVAGIFTRESARELKTTLTLLNAIASPASPGLRVPVAASGMQTTL